MIHNLDYYCRLHETTKEFAFEITLTGYFVRADNRALLRSEIWRSMREDGWSYKDIGRVCDCSHTTVLDSAQANGWWRPDPAKIDQRQKRLLKNPPPKEVVLPGVEE